MANKRNKSAQVVTMLENNTISIDSMYSKQPAYVYGFHVMGKL